MSWSVGDGNDVLGPQSSTHRASPIDVPLHPSDQNDSASQSLNHDFIVGSPDQLDPYKHLRRVKTDDNSNSTIHLGAATDVRPFLGNRSISSPHPPLVRKRANTTTHHVPSGLHPGSTVRGHQWTVFGQLMENEGQLSTPGGTSHRSGRSSNMHASQSVGAASRGDEDPFLDIDVQSPVAEDLNTFNVNLSSGTPTHVNSLQDLSTDDEEYDSDTSMSSVLSSLDSPSTAQAKPGWFPLPRLPTVPLLYRNILKCAVAYFIASLFTFSPYLSGFISDLTSYGPGKREPSPSGHMVATV